MGNSETKFRKECEREPPRYSKNFSQFQMMLRETNPTKEELVAEILALDTETLKKVISAMLDNKGIQIPPGLQSDHTTLCKYAVSKLLESSQYSEIFDALIAVPGCRNVKTFVTQEYLSPDAVKVRFRVGEDGKADCLTDRDLMYLFDEYDKYEGSDYIDGHSQLRREELDYVLQRHLTLYYPGIHASQNMIINTKSELEALLLYLEISDCNIQSITFLLFSPTGINLQKLVHILRYRNKTVQKISFFYLGPDQLQFVIPLFHEKSNIRTLELQNMQFTKSDSAALITIIPYLDRLELRHCEISEEDWEWISLYIHAHKTIDVYLQDTPHA